MVCNPKKKTVPVFQIGCRPAALRDRREVLGYGQMLGHRLQLLLAVLHPAQEGALLLAHGIVQASKGFEVRVSG
jgi:hypothetical protein